MSVRPFEAHLRHQQPRIAVLELRGEINAFAEDALNAVYAEAEASGAEVILLNFANVNYINSTGIALIVTLLARARKAHKRLLSCGLSEHYVEIFNITRLADFMNVYSDEAAAIADTVAHPPASSS